MSPRKPLVLVCNSHIDPVWLWPWEEGLAQALATFRAAADLCEETDGFAFCHNEALLYRWVEDYEPALFERIRRLVAAGRWHVMGGWYLQPDVNMPSGEALVRQALLGKRYFADRLGVEPTVAVNLDSFGHSRGLVQILRKSGYTGYLFCRPDATFLALPADDFRWMGFDGSDVLAHRAADHYNTNLGEARAKIERWLARNRERQAGLLLWGVGNHGGGPSRQDLGAIAELAEGEQEWDVRHGRPEDYVALLAAARDLPSYAGDLNPWGVGCYTSMSRVKQRYRRLENSLFEVEKMLAGAVLHGLVAWPVTELREALEDLLFCQFHDTLAGSSVVEVETQALDRLGHGLEIVGRLRARAFFASLGGQASASDGEYPIFVHNPHPFAVDATVACELQPPEPNADPRMFLEPELRAGGGAPVPFQLEKESCNIQVDQRKRVVFRAQLAPACTTRFSCRFHLVPQPSHRQPPSVPIDGIFEHRSDRCGVVIDGTSGLITRYEVDGVRFLAGAAPRPLVMCDSADPWGMKVRGFRDVAGEFVLMTHAQAARAAALDVPRLAPVRIIERGPARTVVEALFAYGDSSLCLRYALPAQGTEIEIEARVYWLERQRLLKLAFPTPFVDGGVRGQAAFGADDFQRRGEELVAHRWVAVLSRDREQALTIVNDGTYGLDCTAGELRVSLLRSPAYAGHPVDDVTPIVRQDRFEPRIDQGEHLFHFWVNAGVAARRLDAIDRESTVHNEAPFALCAFPPPAPPAPRAAAWGGSSAPPVAIALADDVVQLVAMKVSEDGHALILRLFEPTGEARTTRVSIPPLALTFPVSLTPFEAKTFAIELQTRRVTETDLLERPL
jgi:alpha-mannosidase